MSNRRVFVETKYCVSVTCVRGKRVMFTISSINNVRGKRVYYPCDLLSDLIIFQVLEKFKVI